MRVVLNRSLKPQDLKPPPFAGEADDERVASGAARGDAIALDCYLEAPTL
jgi:hypothetical protein